MDEEKIEASQSLGADMPDLFEPVEITYDEEADDGE